MFCNTVLFSDNTVVFVKCQNDHTERKIWAVVAVGKV